MGGNPSAFGVLSGMISNKFSQARQRKQAEEQKVWDAEMGALQSAVQGEMSKPHPDPAVLDQIYAQMEKKVPKDSIPLVQGYRKFMDVVRRRKSGQTGQGQQGQPGQGQPPPGAPRPAGTSGGGATPGQPVQAAPIPSGAAASPAVPPGLSLGQIMSRSRPSPTDVGTMKGEESSAEEKVARNDRLSSLDSAKKWFQSQGREMPKDQEDALAMWAITGHYPPASLSRGMKMHPVNVVNDEGQFVPGLQIEEGEDRGKVIGPDGKEIESPQILPKWKPRTGWAKDAQGKFFSFNIDPRTNQPIKGTEDYTNLPPSQYLEHYKEGTYQWTDDSGLVHSSPIQSVSGAVVPGGAQGPGAPGARPALKTRTGQPVGGNGKAAVVPPSMRGPGTKGGGAGGDRTLGTKDTGVLSPPAEKVIYTTTPVIQQVDRLLADIDRLKLGDNNTSGYLFTSRLKYKFGKASPEGSLGADIAGLSLGSVVEAASALQGSSRSIQALKKALEHAPNPWVDSPKLIKEKLNTIRERLNDVIDDANKLGRKRQVSTAGPNVPANMKGPAQTKTADQEAEEYLAAHP